MHRYSLYSCNFTVFISIAYFFVLPLSIMPRYSSAFPVSFRSFSGIGSRRHPFHSYSRISGENRDSNITTTGLTERIQPNIPQPIDKSPDYRIGYSGEICTALHYDMKMGAFKSVLPDVFIGSTHYKRALRTLSDVKQDEKINNLRDRNRKFAAQSLDTIMKGITLTVTKYFIIKIITA